MTLRATPGACVVTLLGIFGALSCEQAQLSEATSRLVNGAVSNNPTVTRAAHSHCARVLCRPAALTATPVGPRWLRELVFVVALSGMGAVVS